MHGMIMSSEDDNLSFMSSRNNYNIQTTRAYSLLYLPEGLRIDSHGQVADLSPLQLVTL